jgi:hypothetical protein
MSNPLERLKAEYGDEYPNAVTLDGVRMGLSRERDFSRVYTAENGKQTFVVSRFMDGSASVTGSQVRAAWPNWSEEQRLDFCCACDWLGDHPEFPDILRFVMQQQDLTHISSVASSVAHRLPRDEAFDLLCDALRATNGEYTANITQAIALTKHPAAKQTLLEHLERLWGEADLWKDDPFSNWRAFDATCCIAHLLELGVSPAQLEDKVRLLAAHPCSGNRESCAGFLKPYYAWLPVREVERFGA